MQHSLYPRVKRSGTLCTGGWLGYSAGLEKVEKSLPHPGRMSPQRVAIPTTTSQPSALVLKS